VRVRAGAGEVEVEQALQDLVVGEVGDVSVDGKLYGIELLNANAQLRADGGRLVVDDGTGTERAIAIAL
jgi:hypothetical protein